LSWRNNELQCDWCDKKIEQGEKYYATFRHNYVQIHERCWNAWAIDNSSASLCKMDYDTYFEDEEQ